MTSRIANRSKKRAAQYSEYTVIRARFLYEKNWKCEVCGLRTEDIQCHHKKGKMGNLLTDRRYFLAVCHKCHHKIEMNPTWSKSMGYSLSRLSK